MDVLFLPDVTAKSKYSVTTESGAVYTVEIPEKAKTPVANVPPGEVRLPNPEDCYAYISGGSPGYDHAWVLVEDGLIQKGVSMRLKFSQYNVVPTSTVKDIQRVS